MPHEYHNPSAVSPRAGDTEPWSDSSVHARDLKHEGVFNNATARHLFSYCCCHAACRLFGRLGPKETGGAVIGGVAGGLIGSTVGHGNSQVAATVLGAALGAVVGGWSDGASMMPIGTMPIGPPMRHCSTGKRKTGRIAKRPSRKVRAAQILLQCAACAVPRFRAYDLGGRRTGSRGWHGLPARRRQLRVVG